MHLGTLPALPPRERFAGLLLRRHQLLLQHPQPAVCAVRVQDGLVSTRLMLLRHIALPAA
jgi:hypothetical protein